MFNLVPFLKDPIIPQWCQPGTEIFNTRAFGEDSRPKLKRKLLLSLRQRFLKDHINEGLGLPSEVIKTKHLELNFSKDFNSTWSF